MVDLRTNQNGHSLFLMSCTSLYQNIDFQKKKFQKVQVINRQLVMLVRVVNRAKSFKYFTRSLLYIENTRLPLVVMLLNLRISGKGLQNKVILIFDDNSISRTNSNGTYRTYL